MNIILAVAALLAVIPSPRDIRGPFPIMSTPYFKDGAVDYDALAREVEWVDRCGTPGAIWCQSNDAIDLLTFEEKVKGFETCAKAAEGKRVVLTLGADGTNTAEMVRLAVEIERIAAAHPTAKIAMISRPPDDVRSEAEIERAWDELAKVARRPVIFQTYGTEKTPTPSVELLVRLARNHPEIYGYVKEEAAGYSAVERMQKLSAAKPVIKTAMAGWGGSQWLIQLRQCGCEGLVTERAAVAPVLAEMWRRYERGERGLPLAEAYAMFRLLCDLQNFPPGLRGYQLYFFEKEGIFSNRLSRQYVKDRVTEGGSFGTGHEWKLVDVKLDERQKAELDLLYDEMFAFAGMTPPRPAEPSRPVVQMRLRSNHTDSAEQWAKTFAAIRGNPGCCDEVWFSTGTGAPDLEWHRRHAEILAKAAEDLKSVGIVPSLQFQATLGHGDTLYGDPKMFVAKTWTGWTGSKGVEAKCCNCPRQPAFLDYLRAVSRLYAAFKPAGVWIDDDLRYTNHRPATDGSHIGCWCGKCLQDFNAETGGAWTRETLARAVESDKALAARWRAFSISSLCDVARVIGEEFHRLSPGTMLALQQGNWADSVDPVKAILRTLHEVGGPVGYRPGGGAYYEQNPVEQVRKSLESARFRKLAGDPDYVRVWTPEVESWPRAYASRSTQCTLTEGFTALMYGMTSVSLFVMDPRYEDDAFYSRFLLAPLAAASATLSGYAAANAGTHPVGCDAPDIKKLCTFARTGVPVAPGVGEVKTELTAEELGVDLFRMGSADIQRLRDGIDRRAGGLPAILRSPFTGYMLPRVGADGALRTVALVNGTVTRQGPVTVDLRGLPADGIKVVWREMSGPVLTLPTERHGDETRVTVPSVAAWNGGYLEIVK